MTLKKKNYVQNSFKLICFTWKQMYGGEESKRRRVSSKETLWLLRAMFGNPDLGDHLVIPWQRF
jgi:hypothetical protein